ncbi:MAG: hypothetical protein HYV08_07100 [Deltaproteobacteria bacterium]|nr:hypothetical protein [Deltaproteobacteria bacterium]MBI3076074.1 hypothetical protein [Deltaproteobacteria bacterium]
MGTGTAASQWGGPGVAVAIFRIMFGLLYLDMALQKAPWKNFGWLQGFIYTEIKNPTFGFYKAFLEGVVLPYFPLFGWLTFLTELALGVALVLGALTLLAGVGGALWQLNIAMGAFSVPNEWPWVWVLLIAPQLVFAATRAGRTLGVDRLLLEQCRSVRAAGRACWLEKIV